MIPLTITPNLEEAPWRDLANNCVPEMGTISRIGRLPRGTVSGKSSVSVVITLADGSNVVGETTLALFLAAALAVKARAELEGEELS